MQDRKTDLRHIVDPVWLLFLALRAASAVGVFGGLAGVARSACAQPIAPYDPPNTIEMQLGLSYQSTNNLAKTLFRSIN